MNEYRISEWTQGPSVLLRVPEQRSEIPVSRRAKPKGDLQC